MINLHAVVEFDHVAAGLAAVYDLVAVLMPQEWSACTMVTRMSPTF